MTRVAVFGDVSGHLRPFAAALHELGVDLRSGQIPADLVVVQVGDLIHKGPDGDDLVALADRLMTANPGRWVQLLGNHEAEHLGGPEFGWCRCSAATVATLTSWTTSGLAHLAHPLDTLEDGPLLVTHAGLTFTAWKALGSPGTPTEAAASLDAQLAADRLLAFAPGRLWPVVPGAEAGVVWAVAGDELYESWIALADAVPFGQVHGHTSAYHWERQGWWRGTPPEVVSSARVNPDLRHVRLTIGERPFYGIDPGWDSEPPDQPMAPLLLTIAGGD